VPGTERFIAGIIGSPFGVKGFVKVRPLSGEIDHLLKLKSVILNKDGKERIYQIDESAPSPPFILIRFEGIDTPEAAKTLNGAQIIISREQAAPLGEGEYYIEDLKGLPVQSNNGELIGNVTDIVEGGGGELVEVKLINGDKHLVPFRKEFFSEINPEKGRLLIQDFTLNLLYDNNKYSAET